MAKEPIPHGYTRVSDILKYFKDYSGVNPTVLSEKAKVGDEVHTNIYEEKNDGFPVFSKFPMRDREGNIKVDEEGNEIWKKRGVPYFESFRLWDAEFKGRYVWWEKRLKDDEFMITGQMDSLIEIDGVPTLLDFKTSYNVEVETWALQAHAYWYICKQNNIRVDKLLFLKLHRDGKKPLEHWIDFDESILFRFLQMVHIYNEDKKDAKEKP